MRGARFILCAALCLLPLVCGAQAKLYTKKAKIASFGKCPTLVVSSGGSALDDALRSAVEKRWTAGKFEFVSTPDYCAKVSDPALYFLRFTTEKGIVFLNLEKGGKADDDGSKEVRVDVVSVPVTSEELPSGREFIYMEAYVDIIQQFARDAAESDRIAYGGLSAYNGTKIGECEILLDAAEADRAFAEASAETPSGAGVPAGGPLPGGGPAPAGGPVPEASAETLCGVIVAPGTAVEGARCYKILIGSRSHRVYYFRSSRIDVYHPKDWLEGDLKALEKARAKKAPAK